MEKTDPGREKRVAWIINHNTLRRFELPLLRALGFEVWISKQLPHRRDFFSATIEYSEDSQTTLPPAVLRTLNEHNFYEDELTPVVKECLNTHFATVFCASIGLLIQQLVRHFNGRILVRAFGLLKPHTYSWAFRLTQGQALMNEIRGVSDRFWLAASYDTIANTEEPLLRERTVYLPLGIPEDILAEAGQWTGEDPRVLFVLPRIPLDSSPYGQVYSDFRRQFSRVPHIIAGRQHLDIDDEHVTGYVPDEVFSRWLRECRVMFYHSREPRHLHYHPLEAMVHGMPVLFMRDGLLEHFGGDDQPGACASLRHARRKATRLLRGDARLLETIRQSQTKILEPFSWNFNLTTWRENFVHGVMRTEVTVHAEGRTTAPVGHRLGVLVASPVTDQNWRVANCVARMLSLEARDQGRPLEVVLGCPGAERVPAGWYRELRDADVALRALDWKVVNRSDLTRAPALASKGLRYEFQNDAYLMPRDGCNDYLDCDYWLLIGADLSAPLSPIRPYGVFVLSAGQRLLGTNLGVAEQNDRCGLLATLRYASCLVTVGKGACDDLHSYSGAPKRKIVPIGFFHDRVEGLKQLGTPTRECLVSMTRRAHPTFPSDLQAAYEICRAQSEHFPKELILIWSPQPPWVGVGSSDAHTPEGGLPAGQLVAPRGSTPPLDFSGLALPFPHYLPIIARARILVYNDPEDSLPFPVLEAAHLGVPLVLPDSPYLREASKRVNAKACFYDPSDASALVRTLAEAATSAAMAAPAPLDAEGLGWRRHAKELFEAIYPLVALGTFDAYR